MISVMLVSRPSQLGSGVENGADHLVIAGATAEIPGQPVPRLGFRRVRISVQKGLRRDQQARRAETALQCRMLEELLLQRVELGAPRQAFDRLDRVTLGLDRKHQARADEAAVDDHAAGAAIAGAATFLAARQVELVAQRVQEGLLRLAQEFGGLAVDGRRYVMLGHRRSPARSNAIVAARRTRTPAILVRNSIVPRLSSMGLQARRAAPS